ncbi:HTTM domain-containing protein [Halovivax gelatinilyticus]|uniref:HTTM domain-containing protein n=1 Tax=Halovivax gelatinilyticus TaxID=2961597 RepID=UPI0020CA38B6|nr:HTTM domain-containing protein [Halovivax gelatinilyticus]
MVPQRNPPSHDDRLHRVGSTVRRLPARTRERIARSVPKSKSDLWRAGRERIRIDTRSLAVFRVFVGLLVVADLLLRSRSFSFFYTDDGVITQELARLYAPDHAVSIYYFTSDPTVIAGLFVLQGLFAVQLIVGYKTRLAMILTFLGVISLDHHNPLVLSYADTLFRLLCFWAIFLPLGERWSIDALQRERAPRPSVANLATLFALSQMVFMYVVNGIHKTQSPLWRSGEAAPLVFGLDEMTFLLGDSFRGFETLLQIGGFTWFVMLLFGWLLIALRGRPRLLLTGLFVGGHLSFALTVRIGAFAYVALAGLTLFLQGQFWRDGALVIDRLGLSALPAKIQSGTSRPGRALATVLPTLRVEYEPIDRLRRVTYRGTLTVILVTVLITALVVPVQAMVLLDQDLDEEERFEKAVEETTGIEYVYTVASSLGIDQPAWSIFAPTPRTTDRYYVFPARTVDGERIDVYNDGRPFTFDRAYDELQKQHGTYRERFYMNSIRRATVVTDAPELLADHLCETWPDEHGTELRSIEMFEVTEDVTFETIDDHENRDREYSFIYRHGCGDFPAEIVAIPPDR